MKDDPQAAAPRQGAQAEALRADRNAVWHHLTQHRPLERTDPLMMVSGKGLRVEDVKGNSYLDATSGGVWLVNVGYGREQIADAVRDQLVALCYFANTGGTVPGALFAEALLEKMPGMGRVYYSNSGSEANEKAYKLTRQLAHLKGDGRKHRILYRDRDYHGASIAALSSSGHFERKHQYGPFVPGFAKFAHCCCYRCPFGKQYGQCEIECAQDLETAILREGPDSVGALVLEPVTAGGGVIPPPPEYFPIIQRICEKYEVLLHIDEVVCGFGRTGAWFGYQHFGVRPDMVTLAKGVASGYAALSCTVTTEGLFEQFKGEPEDRMRYFRDISTYGGCTAGPAAALENLRIIERENLVENAARMGERLLERLLELKEKHPAVGDVRGKGLFAGVELVADRQAKTPVDERCAMRVAAHCLDQGVLIGRTNRSFKDLNNTLCLSPALIASRRDIDDIVQALDNALAAVPP